MSTFDTPADLATAGWTATPDGIAIAKSFVFDTFPGAMAFMTMTACVAEAADHHPEWFNVHRRVDVRLTTHDCGGVTDRDTSLARAMEDIAGRLIREGT